MQNVFPWLSYLCRLYNLLKLPSRLFPYSVSKYLHTLSKPMCSMLIFNSLYLMQSHVLLQLDEQKLHQMFCRQLCNLQGQHHLPHMCTRLLH